jgi:uncharacterized membrane-anchored protein YhcB (DUF1043 family)
MAGPTARAPIGSTRDRYLAILVGVLLGYVVGRLLEDRYAWENARMLTMPVGGILIGVLARFTLDRFRDPDDDRNHLRRVK